MIEKKKRWQIIRSGKKIKEIAKEKKKVINRRKKKKEKIKLEKDRS